MNHERIALEQLELDYNPTEILDEMPEFPKFFNDVMVGSHDPDKLNIGYIIGPAGVGKTAALSQILLKLIKDKTLKRLAEQAFVRNAQGKIIKKGKERYFDHLPFERSMRELRQTGEIKSGWGGSTVEDFKSAGEDMAVAIAITKVLLTSQHPEQDVTVLADFVGLSEQRGGIILNTQDYRNAWLMVLLPDKKGELMRRTKVLRTALFKGKKGEFEDKAKEFHLSFDRPLTEQELERMKTLSGDETSVDRVNLDIFESVNREKDILLYYGCPKFNKKSFLNDPALMSDVLYHHAWHLITNRWKFPEDKVLVAENKIIEGDVHVYLSQLETFRRFKKSF